jgi:hypothetical protein
MKRNLSLKFAKYALAAALATAASASWAQTLTNGLIFYAPFAGSLNDTAGGRAGNGLNNPTLPTVGGVGGGGYLQLQNDSANPEQVVWYTDPTPAATDFSFQIWVRTADAASALNGQTEADLAFAANKDWGAGANVGWVLARQDGADGDKFQWNMNTAGGSRKDLDLRTSQTTVFDGGWHQILVTYQRSGNATFYRDGIAVGAVNIAANTGSFRPTLGTWVTNNILALGQDASLSYWHATDPAAVSSLNGDLDEAAMWSRVLSAEDVLAAYAKGTNGVSLNGPLTPFFAAQPQGGTRYTSDNFRLSCLLVDDRGPLTYQWYKSGSPLAGATTRDVLLTNLTVGVASYTVVVSDGVGSVTSAPPASLTVLASAQITDGVAAYLNFDNNLLAQAGTTLNGTAIGADPNPKYTPGTIGSAVTFNNDASASGIPSDWAVSLGDLESIYSNNWAFSLWVNLTNNLDGALLGNKDWTAGGNVGWVFAPYNSLELNYFAASGPRRDIGGVNVRNGQWHHVAGVFNRDANTVYVYVDGTLATSSSLSLTGWESLTPATFSPNDTLVGSSGYGPYSGAGSIDDLGIWKRTLTVNEVLAIYAQGLDGKALTTAVAGSAIKPSISGQPQSLTLFAGRRATLSVAAAGSEPLAYQWYQGGSAVANATNNTLSFNPATTNQQGDYTVVVTNRYGAVTSSPPAVLTVLPITSAAAGLAVYLNFDDNINAQGGTTNNGTAIGADPNPKYTGGKIGNSAVFNNDGNGGGSSDWAVSLGNIEGIYAGSWSFSLWVNATNGNDGALFGNKDWNSGGNIGWLFVPSRVDSLNYRCEASTRYDIGTTTTLDGNWHHVAAVFDREANLVHYYLDGNLDYATNIAAVGTESLTPTTFANDTLIGSSGNDTWSGAGSIDDVGVWIRPLDAQEVLAIFVQGLNGKPLTTASASAIAPLIVTAPQAQTRPEGLSTSFSVTAVGSAPLSYQWRKNGANLPGATNSTLAFPAAIADSGASYSVVVSNPYGSATNNLSAALTVTPSPATITSGLVVYLNFESNLLAQAGTTNSGTAIGAVGLEKYVPGIIGSAAARFDNDNSDSAMVSDWAVSLGDIEWLYANSFSFSIWVKTLDTYGALLGNKNWYSGGNIGWCISEYYTDWLNYRGVGGPRHDVGNFNWADDQWHQVAAVFYREGNRLFTYVDGNLTAQAAIGNTGTESLTPTDIMTTLVGSSGSSNESAYGAVDDLAMWARPLGQAEIVGIYQAGLKGKAVPQASFGAPTLATAISGGSITLSYPDWANGYTLQSSPSLSPTSWTTATAVRNVINGQTVVTVTVGSGAQYFRLTR